MKEHSVILNRIVREMILRDADLAAAFFAIHTCHVYSELHSEAFLEAERNNEIRTLDRAIRAVERAKAYRATTNVPNDFDCVTSTHEV